MQPTTSRDFQNAASQRLTAAEIPLVQKQYLGGYTVECSLKALILHLTPDAGKLDTLKKITSSAKMHEAEVLLGILGDLGVGLPPEIDKRRVGRFKQFTRLRYETGRRDTGETVAFLRTAKAVYDWVEGQLP